jgi:tetratricopeptide (TPR) repeat protein
VTALDLVTETPVVYEKQEAARIAAEIEEKIGQDPIEKELHLHELIGLWELAGQPDKVLQLRGAGVCIYFFAGLYRDALRCGDGLLEMAAKYAPQDEALRREIVIRRMNALIGIQDAKACLQLIETEGLKLAPRAPMRWQADLFYLTAMVYARYLKPRDLAKGEEYLDRSLAAIEQAGYPEERYHFLYVFNRNGVAMIRSFQGRAQEAIDLCRNGTERLNTHVGADKHRLHRSVLVYNSGQVYLAIAHYEEAIKYYSAAIAMDPNFSEYYNERGSIFLRMNRLEEAHADFHRAIELSPPYFEVFTNLGQCYRNMERYQEAVEACSRAIDLEPNELLARLARAQAYEALGNRTASIADYTSALALDPAQWEALANRGVLYYEAGDLEAALADFNSAISFSPDQVNLYQNRSIVLIDLARHEDATRDLETALSLSPTEDDKLLLQHQIDALRRKAS